MISFYDINLTRTRKTHEHVCMCTHTPHTCRNRAQTYVHSIVFHFLNSVLFQSCSLLCNDGFVCLRIYHWRYFSTVTLTFIITIHYTIEIIIIINYYKLNQLKWNVKRVPMSPRMEWNGTKRYGTKRFKLQQTHRCLFFLLLILQYYNSVL